MADGGRVHRGGGLRGKSARWPGSAAASSITCAGVTTYKAVKRQKFVQGSGLLSTVLAVWVTRPAIREECL